MSDSSRSSSSIGDGPFAPLPLPQYAVFWQFLRNVLPLDEDSIFLRIVGFVYDLPATPRIPPPGNPLPMYFFGQHMQPDGPPNMPRFKMPPPSLRSGANAVVSLFARSESLHLLFAVSCCELRPQLYTFVCRLGYRYGFYFLRSQHTFCFLFDPHFVFVQMGLGLVIVRFPGCFRSLCAERWESWPIFYTLLA